MEPKKFLVNDEIKARRVVVIDINGEKLGEFLRNDALNLAEDRELDLVQMDDGEKPVCRIMDYGKFLYEQKKKMKKNANASQSIEVKEIQFGFQTDDHYIQIKTDQARKFLERGDKVKLMIKFSGRESSHLNLIFGKCRTFFENLSDIAEIESPPKVGDGRVQMILAPKK